MPDDKKDQEQLDELTKILAGEAPEDSFGMDVHVASTVAVKASHVRALVKKNPDHPNAEIFAKAVKGLTDNHEIYIDKVDLQAVVDNKEVIAKRATVETDFGPAYEIRKELGDTPKPKDEQSAAKPEHRGPQAHTPVTTETMSQSPQAKNRRPAEPMDPG